LNAIRIACIREIDVDMNLYMGAGEKVNLALFRVRSGSESDGLNSDMKAE
jgi:hypothetical protein